MAKILLCAEGPNDMGFDPVLDEHGRHVDQEGWLQPLIRRLADDDAFLEFSRWPVKTAASISGGKINRKDLPGHGLAAYNAMGKAARERYDLLVFMVDNDRCIRRDRNKWREICQEIWAGFNAVEKPVHGVACIPVSASEAWLLADGDAWQILGLKDTQELPLNKAEEIWGQRGDPDGNRPHEYFTRICRKAGRKDDTITRNALAEHMSPDVLRKHCPISFTPFAHSLQAGLARLGCLKDFDFRTIPESWCTP